MDINSTLVGQLISFVIFLSIVSKYVWPIYIDILVARRRAIEKGLANAEAAELRLEEVKAESEAILAEARSLKNDLISKAEANINIKLAEAKKSILKMHKVEEQRMHDDRKSMEKKLYTSVHNKTVDLVISLTTKLLQKTDLKQESEQMVADLLKDKVGNND